MELDSSARSSSTDNRQYKAVICASCWMFFFFAVIFALHFDSGHSKDDHSLSCPLSNVDCAALFKSKGRNCCKTLCLPLLIEIGKLCTNRQCHFSGVQFVQQFGNKTGQPNVTLCLPAAVGIGNRIAGLVASLSTRAIAAALRVSLSEVQSDPACVLRTACGGRK